MNLLENEFTGLAKGILPRRQVPDILELVIDTWLRLPMPAANELEDPVTNRLCAALQNCPGRETYLFHIRSQTVILEADSGNELGRMDIAFLPFVGVDMLAPDRRQRGYHQRHAPVRAGSRRRC